VPTDPFVPADPADRPRQQQNLPPGAALPPARRWEAARPGDHVAPVPEGPLFGTPGPNVGYAYTLAEHAEDRIRLAPHEELADVIPVVAEVAGRRAALFGRAPVIHDVDDAIQLFGWDGSADADFTRARTLLVQDAGHDYYRRREIVDSVPEELFRRPRGELGNAVYEWRRSLVERLIPELRRQPTM
jgi:hypothetical protein